MIGEFIWSGFLIGAYALFWFYVASRIETCDLISFYKLAKMIIAVLTGGRLFVLCLLWLSGDGSGIIRQVFFAVAVCVGLLLFASVSHQLSLHFRLLFLWKQGRTVAAGEAARLGLWLGFHRLLIRFHGRAFLLDER